MKRLSVFFLFCVSVTLAAQKSFKEPENKTSGHANIRILASSGDQRYVLIHKTYRSNSDTVLVMDSRSPLKPVDTVLKKNTAAFLGRETVLVSGSGKAELISFKDGKRISYDQVKRTAVLKNKQHLIIDSRGDLQICDRNGKLLHTVSHTADFISDNEKLYALRKEKDRNDIIQWDGQKSKTLYAGKAEIDNIILLPSGKFLAVYERLAEGNNDHIQITLVRTDDGKIFGSTELSSGKTDRIRISEINNGKAFLIDFEHTEKPVEDKMLEVWYAGDKTLRNKQTGTALHDYFLLNTVNHKVLALPTGVFNRYAAMPDEAHLWAYHSNEKFSYVGDRDFEVYLYSTEKGNAEKIFERVGRLITSEDRRFTLGYELTGEKWVMYDHQIGRYEILNLKFRCFNPIFTEDGKILFETEKDLLRYDLTSGSSELLNIGKGEQVNFFKFNPQIIHELGTFTVSVRQIKASENLFLKVSRYFPNGTAYYTFDQKNVTEIIPFTTENVRDFTFSSGVQTFFSVEENFNRPVVLNERRIGSTKVKSLYLSNSKDKKICSLKQDILYYKNTLGRSLKGVLYYPVDFDPAKKYPMVVHIYGILHTAAGKFLSPELGDNGFSKRLLLENGYFVFQPDIVNDERGPGISALDCVNSALDQIADHENINQEKIGLIGHSMGGYETCFIATQSKRFAAFVAGASLGDITAFYFSFNELFKIADYSRFETGQLALNVPYAEDKERYFRNNPVNYVENVTAPILLWAGKKDTNVPSGQTMNFFMGLLRNGKKAVALLYNSQKHSIDKNSEELVDLNAKIVDWWNYFLKDQKNIPWIEKEMRENNK